MRKTILLAIAAAIGCSSGGGSSRDPAPGDPQMATVTFAAAFPGSGARSLIHPDTTDITVDVMDESGGLVDTVSLTPASPSQSISLVPGRYVFGATALDAGGGELELAGTAGKVIAGPNSVVITFLTGKWTLTAPVSFSNGWTLDAFYLAYDADAGPQVAAFEPGVPKLRNSYVITYDLDDGAGGLMGEGRLRAYTQFGGAAANRSTFDGGGYDLTRRCGESYDAPFPGACSDQGAQTNRWIRVLGEPVGDDCGSCSPGDRAVSALAPASSFDPDITPVANARIVTGTQIAGTIIEYQFVSGVDELLEGLTGPLPPPPAPTSAVTPDASFAVTVTEYRTVVACRDGFNGTTPDGLVDHGGWHLAWAGPDNDGDGEPDYYEEAWPDMGPVGECNYGLTAADPGDVGEWCDGWWNGFSCDTTGADGVAMSWEFLDMNGDGVVETGSFYLSHVKRQQFQVAGDSYSFTANGTQAGGSAIVIQ